MKLDANRLAASALGLTCVIEAWQRGGAQTALSVAAGTAILLAMIWFSHWFAAGLPRRGSRMLGTPQAHHVQPIVFTVVGWGILAFIAWVLFNPR